MDITVLVAKILGIYLIVAGIYLVFKSKSVPHLLRDFFGHPALTYLTGVILVFLSSLYLLEHNVWNGTWQTVITVFVWLTGIKGVLYIFAPQVLGDIAINKFRGFFKTYGVIIIAVGAYLLTLA